MIFPAICTTLDSLFLLQCGVRSCTSPIRSERSNNLPNCTETLSGFGYSYLLSHVTNVVVHVRSAQWSVCILAYKSLNGISMQLLVHVNVLEHTK